MTQDERDSIMRAIAWLIVLEAKVEENEPLLVHYVRHTVDDLRRIANPPQEGNEE